MILSLVNGSPTLFFLFIALIFEIVTLDRAFFRPMFSSNFVYLFGIKYIKGGKPVDIVDRLKPYLIPCQTVY